ncbi:ABC transporter substrate-binding protein [Paenibacillus sp. NPDC058174]|uniref:ABC transporter substrate-binding protein n=1 Tax=Paenibacillus sp. NPDC058174 TaxID=3346366 RepID=UPI0036DBAB64
MATTLFACSGGNSTENAGKPSNKPSNGEGTAADGNQDPVTFSYYASDPNPNWMKMQDEIGKAITEKTGVTLNAEFAVGDPAQKVSLIAVSGKYPDLISAKNDVNKLVEANALLDLTDLIEQHAPNIKKLYGKYMKRLRYSDTDSSIYVLPTYAGVDHQQFIASGGFELQHRVVKELGYPKIRTVQDYENALKSYLEKNPTNDRGEKNIGLSLLADDWRIQISVTNPAFYTTGAPDDGEYYIDPKTYEATYHFKRPEEKEYFRWLNHMHDIGLLDPESFVQKYDQYIAKIASGRVLGLIDQDWEYGDGERSLKADGKLDHAYGHYPVTLSEEYKDHSFQSTGYLAGYGIAISKTCKDPVRAIKFLDFLASEEGQVLTNWGIEGKHYVVEDGIRKVPADVNDRKINDAINFSKESGIGFYTTMSPHYGDGVKDSTGNYITTNFPEQIVAGYNDIEKEVFQGYGISTWKDLFPKEDEFPVKPWGAAWNISVPANSQVNVIAEKLKDITWKRIPEAILADPAKFDALWDSYMKEIDKAGVKEMEEGYTKLVQARVKLWNE